MLNAVPCRVGRRPTVVISDPNIAVDLMEKRSNKYSSRPRFVVMGEMYAQSSVLVQPYGKDWSLRRKLLHRALTPTALRTYHARQEAESTRLAFQVMANPDNWEREFDRFTASVVFSISYGHRIDSFDAPIIRQRLESMQFMASLNVPGAYLAESFPLLRYIPSFLAPWKRNILEKARLEADANMALVEGVKRDLRIGQEKGIVVAPSLTRKDDCVAKRAPFLEILSLE
jgi:cytochrome P450